MDSYNEQGEEKRACCLDCRWRELRAELYGGTNYWCLLHDRQVPSSRALRQACDQFVDWRRFDSVE